MLLSSNGKYEIDSNNKMLPFIFDISRKHLYYITSNNLNVLRDLLKDSILLGIDTETKPNFKPNNPHKVSIVIDNININTNTNKNKTSLLQIAIRSANTEEYVVIIDLLEILPPPVQHNSNRLGLGVELSQLELDAILKPCFENENVLKVGQGLLQDVKELHQSYPQMTAFQTMNGILDTASLMRHLHPDVLQNLSLKKIVALYLHFNMIKAQQLSDWGRRPLQEKQINYAACDCLVLLRLYDAMICEAEEVSVNTENFDIQKILVHYDCSTIVDIEKNKRKRKKKNSKNEANNHNVRNNHIFGKEIPCNIVESTGVHTHFDDTHTQSTDTKIDTSNNDTHNEQENDNTRQKRKRLKSNHWKPLHGRTVMVVGKSKKNSNT